MLPTYIYIGINISGETGVLVSEGSIFTKADIRSAIDLNDVLFPRSAGLGGSSSAIGRSEIML